MLTHNLLQQSTCAARAVSAVCTPVLPPNASSGLDEASGGSAHTHTHRVATSAAAAVANGTSAHLAWESAPALVNALLYSIAPAATIAPASDAADASVVDAAAGKDRRRAVGDEEADTGAPSTPTDVSAAVAARGRGAMPDAGNGAMAGANAVKRGLPVVATASVVDLHEHALAVNVVAVPLDA